MDDVKWTMRIAMLGEHLNIVEWSMGQGADNFDGAMEGAMEYC